MADTTFAEALHIPLVAVASSLIGRAGYDPERRILAVQFAKTGTIKHYAGVEESLADDFFRAESKGAFLNKHIFTKFQVERMTGPCARCGDEGWVGETCEDCGTATYQAVAPRAER